MIFVDLIILHYFEDIEVIIDFSQNFGLNIFPFDLFYMNFYTCCLYIRFYS